MTGLRLGLALGLLLGAQALAQATPSITVTWTFTQDQVNPATSFAVKRCIQTSAGCPMNDLAGATGLGLSTLSYQDLAITPGITYCYQVAAANQFGRGPFSPVSCGVLGSPPTTAPQNVTLQLKP